MSDNIYLGRQPIVDVHAQLYGFELLFRSSLVNSASIFSNDTATSSVITRVLGEFGVHSVLDGLPGFINCSAAFLMSDEIELLPADKIVLEILEDTAPTPELMARCQSLRNKGYKLALDDFAGINELNRSFLPMMHMVKVDVRSVQGGNLSEVRQQLAPFNTIMLAEKVETEEEFEHCKLMGCQYFQGYYFSCPEVMKGKSLTPGQNALIRVMACLQKDDSDVWEIESIFKAHPALAVSLLRLANSAAIGLRMPLRSLSAAIFALGRRQLERWVLLLLMSEGGGGGKRSLLLHLSATRGKFMELLANGWCKQPAMVDASFVVGMVSLMDRFLGMTMEQVVDSLGLGDDMRIALLEREGELGTLLSLAEALEMDDAADVAEKVIRQHAQGMENMLNKLQGQALAWATEVMKVA